MAQLAPEPPSRDDPARDTDTVVLPRRSNGRTVLRAGVPRVETPREGLRVSVDSIRMENNPQVAQADIERVLAPWRGRDLTLPEFEQAVHAIATFLRENGHPNAQVQVARDTTRGGQIAMAIAGLQAGEPKPPTLEVRDFAVEGLTVASADEIRGVLAPWTGRQLTVAELQEAAEAVAAHLRNKGYVLAQAFLPPQRIDGGTIRIAVQEGIVDGTAGNGGVTVVQSGERVRPQVIETILTRGVTPGQPLDGPALDRALRIAGDLPGVREVRANLAPGAEPGTTQVQATVEDDRLLSGAVWADNYGSAYSGSARVNTLVNVNSPFGSGDQFSLAASASEGAKSIKIAGQTPIGSDGLRVGASFSALKVDIGRELAPLSLNSKTTVFSLFGNYPIRRSAESNLNVGLNTDYKIVNNELLGQPESDRRIPVGTASLGGDFRDGLDGRNVWSVSASFGSVDLSNNAGYKARDAAGADTQGSFGKLNASLSRTAPIGGDDKWFWYGGLSGQLASKNLDSVEKFQLGGPTGVRAYPVGEALGDDGFLASLELHRHLFETPFGPVHAFGLFDVGGIRQFSKPNGTVLGANAPNEYTLAGYGFGFSLSSSIGNLQLTVARRLGHNPNTNADGSDSDGQSRDPRIWITSNVRF